MGRNKNTAAEPVQDMQVLPAVAQDIVARQEERAVAEIEQDKAVREVAGQIGYQLPADSTNPDLIQRDIAANMRRSVEACLEVGRGITVLKAASLHGDFLNRLSDLNIDRKVAARFMQAAAKFSNVATSRHLIDSVGSQSKLFEMLVLDDEQIVQLEETGQTSGLTLDDVAVMSVKELRAALREAKEEFKAKEKLLGEKGAQIDKLKTELIRSKDLKIAATAWPERFQGLLDQAHQAEKELEKWLNALEAIRVAGMEDEAKDTEEEASLSRAREALAARLVKTQRGAYKRLETLANIFDKTLGSYTDERVWE